MALCSLCQSIPVSSLPTAQQPNSSTYIGDNRELVELWYKDKEAPLKDPLGFPWHEDLDALAKSAKTGCPLCVLVQTGAQTWIDHYRYEAHNNELFKEFHEHRGPFPEGQRLWLTKRFGGADGFILLVRNPKSDTRVNLLTGVGFSVESGNPLANVFPLRPLELNSGSLNSLNVAGSWIRNCLDNHERCSEGDVSLPSRVLDIGSSNEVIKLVDTTDLSGRYASLSYCWGTSPDFITSKESIKTRQSGICLSDLPQTLVDAVTIARHLGLRYLWIDSLCICQDDADDWARESARMIDVYSKAHLVISANNADDKAIGCFHQRDISQSAIIILPLTHPQKSSEVHVTLLFPRSESPFFDGGFQSEPLARRGWALQERTLARRNLHYSNNQMYFECNHGIVGENGCYSEKRYCNINKAHGGLDSLPRIKPPYGVDRKVWNGLLWAYGTRKLTRPSDKLPAMSGLARLFEQRLRAEYVAGLWSNALIEGLAWQGLGDRKAMDNEEYIGPSWSWASYAGIAATGLQEGWIDTAEVLEWHVDLKNEANPYGEVKNAWIRLRAPIAKLAASEKKVTDHEVRLSNAGIIPLPRLRTKYSDDEDGTTMDLDSEIARTSGEWRNWNLYVLLLGGYRGLGRGIDRDKQRSDGSSYALVVVKADDKRIIKPMKRVGWMFLSGDEARKVRDDEGSWTTVTLI